MLVSAYDARRAVEVHTRKQLQKQPGHTSRRYQRRGANAQSLSFLQQQCTCTGSEAVARTSLCRVSKKLLAGSATSANSKQRSSYPKVVHVGKKKVTALIEQRVGTWKHRSGTREHAGRHSIPAGSKGIHGKSASTVDCAESTQPMPMDEVNGDLGDRTTSPLR